MLMTFFWVIVVVVLLTAILFSDEVRAAKDRDPAARNTLEILLLYPGLHAVIFYRIASFLWRRRIPLFPRLISQLGRLATGIEIHPGAIIGKGFFIDHGMGVVIGETTVIGDNVSLFQGVTLGGTGKETGKRHPTIEDNVVVGAGAKVLGNIVVGKNSYIGANAVILRNVPPNATVVGVPGHVTRQDGKRIDLLMDHVHVSDPVMQNIKDILQRVRKLEGQASGRKKNED